MKNNFILSKLCNLMKRVNEVTDMKYLDFLHMKEMGPVRWLSAEVLAMQDRGPHIKPQYNLREGRQEDSLQVSSALCMHPITCAPRIMVSICKLKNQDDMKVCKKVKSVFHLNLFYFYE